MPSTLVLSWRRSWQHFVASFKLDGLRHNFDAAQHNSSCGRKKLFASYAQRVPSRWQTSDLFRTSVATGAAACDYRGATVSSSGHRVFVMNAVIFLVMMYPNVCAGRHVVTLSPNYILI